MIVTKEFRRHRIKNRIRKIVTGAAQRPRLSVFRSNKQIYAQLIDDVNSVTIVGVHSKKLVAADLTGVGERKGKTALAFALGKKIAELAKAAGITTVVFDRAGFRYHGRVEAVADGAREGGLIF